MDADCLGHQFLCPTRCKMPRMSTVYGNDDSFPDNLSLRSLPFHCRFSKCHYPLQFTSHLCWRYDLSPYHSSARSIYIVPFTFSLLAKAFIYSVFATKYPLTISSHLRRTACVLDDAESIHLVHFTCSSWQGFCYIFSVRFVSL